MSPKYYLARLKFAALVLLIGLVALIVEDGPITRINLGEELGIGLITAAITIGAIDIALDRQRNTQECLVFAWDLLHDLDNLTWVWLGGHRRFDYIEMLGLLQAVDDSHVMAKCTRKMLEDLGAKADKMLGSRRDWTSVLPALLAALEDIHRTFSSSKALTPLAISEHLRRASHKLATMVGIERRLAPGRDTPDASIEAQERRFTFGL